MRSKQRPTVKDRNAGHNIKASSALLENIQDACGCTCKQRLLPPLQDFSKPAVHACIKRPAACRTDACMALKSTSRFRRIFLSFFEAHSCGLSLMAPVREKYSFDNQKSSTRCTM